MKKLSVPFVPNMEFKSINLCKFKIFSLIHSLKRNLSNLKTYMFYKTPYTLLIETTSICNFRCKMCPLHTELKKSQVQKGIMNMDLFYNIIRQAKEIGIKFVIPQGAGEPFMHPNFLTILEVLKKNGFMVGFNTNASFINKYISKIILNLNIDDIGFSVDALNSDTFSKITNTKFFNLVKSNILNFIELKKKYNLNKPYIRILLVELPENLTEIQKYIDFWIDKVDEVVILKCRSFDGRHLANTNLPQNNRPACNYLFNTIFIQWDGAYDICCEDWNREFLYYDFYKTNLKAFWLGDKMEKFRSLHKKKLFNKISICSDCQAWQPAPIKLEYTKNGILKIIEPILTRYKKIKWH